ncbi:MAG: non-canonical purine NTP pyrophosphatase [Synergistaceae bacterium]|nr:non-canonical purine NTP pyrophosphatase [Synergistaceae bacterium]
MSVSRRSRVFDRLLLATGNRHKYGEFLELLPRRAVKDLIFAPELPRTAQITEVDETGSTYVMNALLKALAWSAASGLPSLADDSGLEVEALGWKPGVRSARVFDEGRFLSSDAERNQWLLTRMEGKAGRRARFVAAVVLSVPGEWALACEGVCDGRLAVSETGAQGFGYDPLFIPDGYDISFGELPPSVKNRISHRARAVAALLDIMADA